MKEDKVSEGKYCERTLKVKKRMVKEDVVSVGFLSGIFSPDRDDF